jgi:hypothetical protein
MSIINIKNGLLRLWIFAITSIAIITFICDIVGYNFYWLIPTPFSDLCIHLHNYLIYVFDLRIQNTIGLAIVTSLSNVVVIGLSTIAIGYGIIWVRKGFTNP